MKVLLCCAGGLSSSILMKKMKTWADAHGEDLEIQAMGTGEAVETWQNGYEYGCLHDTEVAFPDLEKSAIRIKNDLFEEVSHDQGRER